MPKTRSPSVHLSYLPTYLYIHPSLMYQRTSPCWHLFSPLQGISIRPLIEFINVRRTNRDVGTINVEVHCRVSPLGRGCREC